MKVLLICPSDRAGLASLTRTCPLALVPVLGRSLLDLHLAHLASLGAREVRVLAADRPEMIRAAAGRGERWGLRVEVLPEPRESDPETARQRHRQGPEAEWLTPPRDVAVADRLPGAETGWTGPSDWVKAVRDAMPAASADRVGMREIAAGTWVHVRARVEPSARLVAPCWVGARSWIGARAVVGPGSVVEEGSYVDEGAEVTGSLVGPSTYVGAWTAVRDSVAWGTGLLKWTTGSFTEVRDAFLLGPLGDRARFRRAGGWFGRVAALGLMALTWPVIGLAWLVRRPDAGWIRSWRAVRAPVTDFSHLETFVCREFPGLPGLGRRWPQLWNVVRGELAWVGNRPLNEEQARQLTGEFERLWLAVPPGWISLADAEGVDGAGEEALAHASYYAASPAGRLDGRILRTVLLRGLAARKA